jgi:inorganic pyrophosphatase
MKTRIISVIIDRRLGTSHPKYKNMIYPINYGYVEGVFAPDGEEQDVYVLGIDFPIEKFIGKLIAIVHRNDDIEEKWVACPENMSFTQDEIRKQIHFTEQYFDSYIEML